LVTAKAKTKAKVGIKVAKREAVKAPKGKVVSKPAPKTAKKTPPKPAPKTAKKTAPKPAPRIARKVIAKAITRQAPKTIAKSASGTAAKGPVKIAANRHGAVSPLAVKSPGKPSTTKIGAGLSEVEVIKQAKTDYMSRQQLAFFKQRLLDLQNELRENAGATTEHLREISVAPDPADRATLEEEHALELRTRDRERKLLKKVQSALMRIEDGSYGYCEETGEPIGIQRLMARPTATLTIEAQERRELKQKMYGE
jgi:DnaK suppressor protein